MPAMKSITLRLSLVFSIYFGDCLDKNILFIIESLLLISFNDDVLTINNRFKYIRRIGVIRELSNYSFMTDNVYDELSYSLLKLNLKEEEINRRIKLYLKLIIVMVFKHMTIFFIIL